MHIRPETPADRDAVRAVNDAAFGTTGEGRLVDLLREQLQPLVSLVAEDGGAVIGHILFSPVRLSGHADLHLMGLGPMAVLPAHQRQGVGSALVRAGLRACGELGFGGVVVLGHPGYYPRFGFTPAAHRGIHCEYDAPPEAFMVLELLPTYLSDAEGTISYHPSFAQA